MLYFGDLLAFNAHRIYIYIYVSAPFFYSYCKVSFKSYIYTLNCSDVQSVLEVPLGIT